MIKKVALVLGLALATATVLAQPFVWPAGYNPSEGALGTVQETIFSDINTLNPYLTGSATETAVLGLYAGPALTYRDWLGTRSHRNADGGFNLYFAQEIEEVVQEQEFVITLREGWFWSDGVEMTADDAIASFVYHGDPAVQSNGFGCSVVGNDPVEFEKLSRYQYRIRLPAPQVNAIVANDCANSNGLLPAHVFMPVYENEGPEAAAALWGVDADVSQLVSGGPYVLTEFRPGERLVLEPNPVFNDFVQTADGSPVPGAGSWVVTQTADQNAELSLVVTNQVSFYWPTTLDQVRAVQEAVTNGTIDVNFYPNISPSTSVDFITYNFNSTDTCKSDMFRERDFRRAMSLLMDREAMVQAAVGGLGFAAKHQNTDVINPFTSEVADFEFSPTRALELLAGIGFTETDSDGVLLNPDSGCRVEFDLQFNSGNERRGQLALVAAQTAAEYGVKINPREVSTQIWVDSITGTTMPRTVDYDAQVWGLSGGDPDNPSSRNVLRIASNLNSWNKDSGNVEAWELLMDQLTVQMDQTLDLAQRVEVYQERSALMREWLPLTPLIAQSFHFYENLANDWPTDALNAVSIQSPYNPANFRENLALPAE
jgi:peptide/nickel transport system substrate-binding protein